MLSHTFTGIQFKLKCKIINDLQLHHDNQTFLEICLDLKDCKELEETFLLRLIQKIKYHQITRHKQHFLIFLSLHPDVADLFKLGNTGRFKS